MAFTMSVLPRTLRTFWSLLFCLYLSHLKTPGRWKIWQGQTRERLPVILESEFKKRITSTVFKNGFKRCGIYPFDENADDYTKCIKSRSDFHLPEKAVLQHQEWPLKTFEKCLEIGLLGEFMIMFASSVAWSGRPDSAGLFWNVDEIEEFRESIDFGCLRIK